jgi:hypothetical protein
MAIIIGISTKGIGDKPTREANTAEIFILSLIFAVIIERKSSLVRQFFRKKNLYML